MKIDEIDFGELLPSGSPRFRRLASGAVRDEAINRIVAREITSEEGRAMGNKRWEKWRRSAASAILKEAQSIDPSIKTEEQAWGLLIAKQYTAFLDSEKPRGDDLLKFGQILGAMPTIADSKNDTPPPPDANATLLIIQELTSFVSKMDKREIINGKAKNVSNA